MHPSITCAINHATAVYPHLAHYIKSTHFIHAPVNRRITGLYNNAQRKITINNNIKLTDEQIFMTTLHEIAHAIDYKVRGKSNHDKHWKSIAVSLGHSGNAKNSSASQNDGNFKYVIYRKDTNEMVAGYFRKPRGKNVGVLHGFTLGNDKSTDGLLVMCAGSDYKKMCT